MKKPTYLLALGAFLFFACTQDRLDAVDELDQTLVQTIERVSPSGDTDYFQMPDPFDYASIPQDPANPLSNERVFLGKMLFFETGLALEPKHQEGKNSFSCATCHIPSRGFTAGRLQGIADGGEGFGDHGEARDRMAIYGNGELDVQGNRPLSMLNAAFTTNGQWNGQMGYNAVNTGTEDLWNNTDLTHYNRMGLSGIEVQARGGLDVHRMVVNKAVIDSLGMKDMFDQAFPEVSSNFRYTKETAALALAAYLRHLIPNRAPFQQWLGGDKSAMNQQEKIGATLFFGKAKCYQCHTGPGLNNTAFFALGVKDMYETGAAYQTGPNDKKTKGRGSFTHNPADDYKFKVPQLYNLADYTHYFHGSSKRNLKEVVEYFNNGIPESDIVPKGNIAPQFIPLGLNEAEIQALTVFLKTGLYDGEYQRFVPDSNMSGYCFPNNDPQSQIDLGCK